MKPIMARLSLGVTWAILNFFIVSSACLGANSDDHENGTKNQESAVASCAAIFTMEEMESALHQFHRELGAVIDLDSGISSREDLLKSGEIVRYLLSVQKMLRLKWVDSTLVFESQKIKGYFLEIRRPAEFVTQRYPELKELDSLFRDGYRVLYNPFVFLETKSRLMRRLVLEAEGIYMPLYDHLEDELNKIRFPSEDFLLESFYSKGDHVGIGAEVLKAKSVLRVDSLFHITLDYDRQFSHDFFQSLNQAKNITALVQKVGKMPGLRPHQFDILKLHIEVIHEISRDLLRHLRALERELDELSPEIEFGHDDFESEGLMRQPVMIFHHPTNQKVLHLDLLSNFELKAIRDIEKAKVQLDEVKNQKMWSVEAQERRQLKISELQAVLRNNIIQLIESTRDRVSRLIPVFAATYEATGHIMDKMASPRFNREDLLSLTVEVQRLAQDFYRAELEFIRSRR